MPPRTGTSETHELFNVLTPTYPVMTRLSTSSSTRRSRGRRALVIVIANLVAVAILLVAAEGVARLIVWGWGIPTAFQPQPFQGFGQTDPVVWWRLQPNLDTWMIDVRLKTNALGFRDPRQSPDPKALRVYCLGDSSTFGWRVKDSQMYTRVAEEILAEVAGRPVNVISTGVPGYTSYQCLQQYRDQIARLKPDWIVVMASNNECRARSVGDRSRGASLARKQSLQNWLGFSRVWLLLTRTPEALTRNWDDDPAPGRVANTPDEYRENLRDLLNEARASGSRVLFMNMPLRLRAEPIWKHFDTLAPEAAKALDQAETARMANEPTDRVLAMFEQAIQIQPDQFAAHSGAASARAVLGQDAEADREYALAREADLHPDAAKPSYNRVLEEFCRAERVPFVDLDRAFRASGRPEAELFLDHCHPSALGHRIIGSELSRTLEELVKNP